MKVTLIYLAAGNGRRFENSICPLNPLQRNKLLFPIEGQPMYLHLLKSLARICQRHPSWEVLVVTQYQEIMDGAKELGVRAVFSPESFRGASWSVKAGLSAAEESDACAFFVADQPFLKEETAEAFLMAMEGSCEEEIGKKEAHEEVRSKRELCEEESGEKARGKKEPENSLGCVSCQGMTGNPVWFSKKFFPELLELKGDQGGKRVLKAHWDEAKLFPVTDPAELRDIDVWTPEGTEKI